MKKLTRAAVLIMTMSLTLSSLFSEVRSAPEASSLKLAKKFDQLGGGDMVGTSYLLDLQSGKIRTLRVNAGLLHHTTVSPDGKWFLGRSDGYELDDLYIHNVADGRTKLMGKLPKISSYHWESTSTSFIVYYDGSLLSKIILEIKKKSSHFVRM